MVEMTNLLATLSGRVLTLFGQQTHPTKPMGVGLAKRLILSPA